FGTEAHETEKFSRAGYQLFRTNMKVTAALSTLPPLMELIGGIGMAAAIIYGSQQIAPGRAAPGPVPPVQRYVVPDVGAGQETQPGQREPAAGDRRGRADLRDARRPHRSAGAAGRGGSRAVPRSNRVPRRRLRLRPGARPDRARHLVHRP